LPGKSLLPALIASLGLAVWCVAAPPPPAKKAAPKQAPKTAAKAAAKVAAKAPAAKAGVPGKAAARPVAKGAARPQARYAARGRVAARRATPARTSTTWQRTPTPERYREIQQALVEKGFYSGEANGTWGADSVDALKRFQAEQNLPTDGKLNSLTLIALGLGPKRNVASNATPPGAPNPSVVPPRPQP
jgi:murein L,D-transpeptidase YcbB/YkuD